MFFAGSFRIRAGALIRVILVVLAFAASFTTAASSLTLAWDANSETDIAGYKVYLGNSSRDYSFVIDAGTNANQILLNLVPGATYYFAVTAYNAAETESDFSAELRHTVPNTAPLISNIISDTMPANGSLTIAFTINDAETPVSSLTVTGTSSNPTLVLDANLLFEGSGVARTVTVTPAADQSGTTTITIIVSDGSLTTSKSFTISVSVPPTALVAAHSFDVPSGTTLDLSGNGNTGTVRGAAWTTSGRFGGALVFDGIDDSVTVPDADSLDLTTGMTVEAWAYPTTQTLGVWRNVLIKEREAGEVYNLYANSDTMVPAVSTVRRSGTFDELRGTTPVSANTWTHLAATYDDTTLRLFVNGIEVSSITLRGPLLTSAGPLRIGGNGIRGEHFQGMIDEVRIYNRPLSPPEIQADMRTPVGSPSSFIGNTEDGILTDVMGASWINAGRYQATANLTVNTMFAKVAAISGRYKCAIYTDSGGQPSRLLQSSAEINSPTTGWQLFPLSSPVVLTNGQYYWLAIWSDDPDSGIYYSGTDGTLRWGNYNYGTWPDPFATAAGANVNYCIYATDVLTTLSETADAPAHIPSATTEVPFVIEVITVGDSHLIRLTWESIPGAIYRVLGKTDPLEPNWLDISADILAEDSVTSWVNSDTTALANMYRVFLVE